MGLDRPRCIMYYRGIVNRFSCLFETFHNPSISRGRRNGTTVITLKMTSLANQPLLDEMASVSFPLQTQFNIDLVISSIRADHPRMIVDDYLYDYSAQPQTSFALYQSLGELWPMIVVSEQSRTHRLIYNGEEVVGYWIPHIEPPYHRRYILGLTNDEKTIVTEFIDRKVDELVQINDTERRAKQREVRAVRDIRRKRVMEERHQDREEMRRMLTEERMDDDKVVDIDSDPSPTSQSE